GIEFLRRLMPQYPLPVVMISGYGENVFEALNAGAVDFVAKPDVLRPYGMDSLINELIVKIKIASTVKVGHWKKSRGIAMPLGRVSPGTQDRLIAIGASTGGTEAIFQLLSSFSVETPGIVIVQHMPPGFTDMFAQRLNKSCAMEVKEARTGDAVFAGRVLIAAGDCHMRIRRSGNKYMAECQQGEKVSGHCPSVDVLFNSVADSAGSKGIGVILTGMGSDGAQGLLAMRKRGALTIGQDEKTCIVYGMPKVAYDIGAVMKQVPLQNIPQTVYSLLGQG
ncbi:MAG: chemotaxis protein CheB, partial [Syntrophaceae bacterium]